jgi:hypothetical protein
VLRETTSRGLCGLGCPSRTSVCVLLLQDLLLVNVCVFITAHIHCSLVRDVNVFCVCLLLQDLVHVCVY